MDGSTFVFVTLESAFAYIGKLCYSVSGYDK